MLVADKPKRKKTSKVEAHAADRRIKSVAVASYITNYFMHFDVPIGVNLHDKRYIDMCLDCGTCGAVDMAYKSMGDQNRFQSSCGDGTMGEDVRLVIRLLKGIRAKCIPQEFSAGILLMHLEIVEGLRF